jgi:hypothetical protein
MFSGQFGLPESFMTGTGFFPTSEIHSFNFLGGYIGRVFQAQSIGETSGLVGPIRSIDVLTEYPNAPGVHSTNRPTRQLHSAP